MRHATSAPLKAPRAPFPAAVAPWPEAAHEGVVQLAIVVPTYNERDNIAELVQRLTRTLAPLHWEVLFVDDDSPDGTAGVIESLARRNPRVRLIRRIGRRGLTSACIEGVMATTAPLVAVMDADLQHDEAALPAMVATLTQQRLDLVVGTRNAAGGSMGEFQQHRVLLSRAGRALSRLACRTHLTDPMSGFFLVERGFFLECVGGMQGNGFKILLDMLSSSPRSVRLGEVGYRFRNRRHGESKLDLSTGIEYFSLVISKLSHGALCPRVVMSFLIGMTAMAAYLASLLLMRGVHQPFLDIQATATVLALTFGFLVNNAIATPDRRLRGRRILAGLAAFGVLSSFGVWVNLVLAATLLHDGVSSLRAGLVGAFASTLWSSSATFRLPRPRRQHRAEPVSLAAAAQRLEAQLESQS